MPARSGGGPLQFSTRRTWRCHLGFSFGWLGVPLCPSSSSDFSLPACGGPSHFPALQPALVHLPASSCALNRRQRLAATQTLNNQTCCVGPAAALASFACPLAPSNSLSSSAAASGLDRVPPMRAAHGRPLVGRDRSPPRQSQPPRVFCPVPTCPCSDPARARGWATVATMKSHINAHLAGSLQGDVPIAWLHCLVCGLNFSQAHGVHPTCRPEARAAAVDAAIPMDTDGLQLPSLSAIQPPRLPPCGIPLAMLGLRS